MQPQQTIFSESTISLPMAFREVYLTDAELRQLLKLSESQFWNAVKRCFIPPGLELVAADRFILVWERQLIADWMAAGFPAAPGVVERDAEMSRFLKECVAAEHPELNLPLNTKSELN
ncbi:hypothetical protein [Planctomicrobium sp. SH664]|uniref:hypothetical protein n=1 Tax=Planctomicrobium sp. SH664 TaxID=3448125 RepID=UPI003F5BCCBC